MRIFIGFALHAHLISYAGCNLSDYSKLPTNTRKFAALQRPIATYFSNLHHLLRTLPEPRMQYVALSESAKMVPYLVHNRRAAREYVKVGMPVPRKH